MNSFMVEWRTPIVVIHLQIPGGTFWKNQCTNLADILNLDGTPHV